MMRLMEQPGGAALRCTWAVTLGLGAISFASASPARAAEPQLFAYPTTEEDLQYWYPTAYLDHGGVDWNCGEITYAGHIGSDFGGGSWEGMAAGRDVTAAADGIVSWTHDGEFDGCAGDCPDGGFGNNVWIRHVDGEQTVYGHLKTGSIPLVEGDRVRCGDLVGQMGSSGNSTGPHLHFGLRTLADTWADPFVGPCGAAASRWVEQGEYAGLPSRSCAEPPLPCAPQALISCGAVVAASNGDPAATDDHVFYGCDHDLVSTGPELAWRFVTDLDEPVTVELTGLAADLDLYLLDSAACDTQDCVDVSRLGDTADEQITFQASSGVERVLVVDGYAEAVSAFTLSVSCNGGIPEEPPETEGSDTGDTGDTGEPGDTDTDDAGSESGDGDTDSDEGPGPGLPGDDSDSGAASEDGRGDGGCGCAGTREPALAWLLPGLALALRRRRGREPPR